MSDYVASVLDDLVPRFDDERGDWDRVVADADLRLANAGPARARGEVRARINSAVAMRRPRRRRGLVALAFVAAAIVAGTAYGVVHELVIGDPAPEDVRQALARFGHEAELIPYPRPEDPRVEDARVAGVLESSVGPVYLFSAPTASGMICGWDWIEGQRDYQGRPDMGSVCGVSETTFFAVSRQFIGERLVRLLYGRASDGVERVTLRFGERTVDVPLTGRWFFAELFEEPSALVTYDASGHVVDGHELPPLPHGPPAAQPQPRQVGATRTPAKLSTSNGELISLEVASASNGGYCMTVRSDRRRPNSSCSIPLPKPREIAISAMNFGGAPGGVLLLVGPAGSEIARLELRYEDGRLVLVPVSEGWALFEIKQADYAQGHRPDLLIGRDKSGRVVASEHLPWASAGG
jgi:hypothetical protein